MLPIKPMPEVNKSEKHPTELHQRSALQKFIFFAFGMIAACGPLTPGIGALAMQAELPQMETTNESPHWLAGGIMSLIKAWWSGALSSGNKRSSLLRKTGDLFCAGYRGRTELVFPHRKPTGGPIDFIKLQQVSKCRVHSASWQATPSFQEIK